MGNISSRSSTALPIAVFRHKPWRMSGFRRFSSQMCSQQHQQLQSVQASGGAACRRHGTANEIQGSAGKQEVEAETGFLGAAECEWQVIRWFGGSGRSEWATPSCSTRTYTHIHTHTLRLGILYYVNKEQKSSLWGLWMSLPDLIWPVVDNICFRYLMKFVYNQCINMSTTYKRYTYL